MSKVFVIDTNKRPLDPVHPGRARLLLAAGKAAVYRRYPFTIVLYCVVDQPQTAPFRIKIDPGSRTTGIAILNDQSDAVVFAAEITHHGQAIKEAIDGRRTVRKNRRRRQTRYRPSHYHNRCNQGKGWLPPSLESRISNVLTWVQRLRRYCPISVISLERVKFDLQQMENPDIAGVQYQQGTLFGYELKEYLLEKWGHRCVYCGVEQIPLQIEHIVPRAIREDNRVCNLTLACQPCNQKKGKQDVHIFLADQPERLAKLLKQAKAPLKDVAAVNATRNKLFELLKAEGLPVECGSGGLTKFNRTILALPKTHWLDAACIGKSTPKHLQVNGIVPLLITANGHGNRQMCGVDKHGFPIRHRKRQKVHYGYQTGDMIRAVIPAGLKTSGTYYGRVLARATGAFDIGTRLGRVAGVSYRFCRPVHRNDGYSYTKGTKYSSPT